MIPVVGSIVHYRLSRQDALDANRRKNHAVEHLGEHRTASNGVQIHVGNHHSAGDIVPLLVVRVWEDEYFGGMICRDSLPNENYDSLTFVTPKSGCGINGQAFLDGSDVLWITSAPEATANGCWSWPDAPR